MHDVRPPALVGPTTVALALALVLTAGGVTAVLEQGSATDRREAVAGVGSVQAPPSAIPSPAVPSSAAAAAPLPTEPVAPASTAPAAPPPVAPLGELRVADLVVTATTSLTPTQVSALQAVPSVEAVAVLDGGTVRVGGKDARVAGVDPSKFRAFTPQETASSDALWQSVARGELAPSYSLQRARTLVLGSRLLLDGPSDVEGRIGAVAAYGLPGVDVVVDRATARSLGVVPSSTVLVSAPDGGIAALRRAVRAVVGAGARVEVLRVEVAKAAVSRGQRTYRDLYVDGARYCPGLSWTVLAAIGQVESGHGKDLGPSSAGALGPMQFLPSTWAAYGVDGDRDGTADIMSPYDAIPAAAGYLCRFGATRGPDGLYDAVFAYNHADWYVRKVLGVAKAYEGE